MSSSNLAVSLVQATAREWFIIVTLVFGGCCSNALATEWLTLENPHAGKLITFAQFTLVSLFGLAKHLRVSDSRSGKDIVADVAARVLKARRGTSVFMVAISADSEDSLAQFTDELNSKLRELETGTRVAASSDSASPSGIRLLPTMGKSTARDCEASITLGSALPASGAPSTLCLDSSAKVVMDATGIFVREAPTQKRSLWSKLLRIRLKPRKIPIRVWLVQVALFLLTSLLNNAAFAYKVPMSIHIIFRSAGSLTNMLFGYMLGRRYTRGQVLSLLLVTAGVAASTYSAIPNDVHISAAEAARDASTYWLGIGILSLALVFSSFMGFHQDKIYGIYGRGNWEEALFYLHFLAMPMFLFMRDDLSAQIATANASPPMTLSVAQLGAQRIGGPFMLVNVPLWARVAVVIPSLWVPLALNVGTQLLCVTGVNRLTSRVSSLTVALVLVLRKALSLWISVVLLGRGNSNVWLWSGAFMVLLGTIWYALDSRNSQKKAKRD